MDEPTSPWFGCPQRHPFWKKLNGREVFEKLLAIGLLLLLLGSKPIHL